MPPNSFAVQLNRWYRKNARDLPWRKTRDPYKIWISEVMLQQTTVNAVIPYYKRWIKEFPTMQKLAGAPVQKVFKMWQGLGYYNRARNAHKASKEIVARHHGKVPADYDQLRKMPGFGNYTAGAVLSIAFDKRVPIIDANVKRVIMRLLAIEEAYSSKTEKRILVYLDEIMPKRNLRTFNQALMELGAVLCKNKEPLCSMCPVKGCCAAFKKGVQELIPLKEKRVSEEIDVVVGLIRYRGRIFIQKRPPNGLLADLWEFPGGKMEKGESQKEALSRELKEELNISIKNVRPFKKVRHFYTRFKVNLYAYSCEPQSLPALNASRKWVKLGDFSRYPMPSGTAKLVSCLY